MSTSGRPLLTVGASVGATVGVAVGARVMGEMTVGAEVGAGWPSAGGSNVSDSSWEG
mgnify:CR=1 FL=1